MKEFKDLKRGDEVFLIETKGDSHRPRRATIKYISVIEDSSDVLLNIDGEVLSLCVPSNSVSSTTIDKSITLFTSEEQFMMEAKIKGIDVSYSLESFDYTDKRLRELEAVVSQL